MLLFFKQCQTVKYKTKVIWPVTVWKSAYKNIHQLIFIDIPMNSCCLFVPVIPLVFVNKDIVKVLKIN